MHAPVTSFCEKWTKTYVRPSIHAIKVFAALCGKAVYALAPRSAPLLICLAAVMFVAHAIQRPNMRQQFISIHFVAIRHVIKSLFLILTFLAAPLITPSQQTAVLHKGFVRRKSALPAHRIKILVFGINGREKHTVIHTCALVFIPIRQTFLRQSTSKTRASCNTARK